MSSREPGLYYVRLYWWSMQPDGSYMRGEPEEEWTVGRLDHSGEMMTIGCASPIEPHELNIEIAEWGPKLPGHPETP